MKKIAVILSGCGVYDGSEIHEAVITLLSLDSHDVAYQCFAPDMPQLHVVDHLTGEVAPDEARNVLHEAARIARGNVKPITELKAEEYDGIIFPGGFGVAKNLCSFATEGTNMTIQADVAQAARAFAEAKKPAGYICIAPAMVAGIYGPGVRCTIGNDPDTAAALETMGATHVECPVDDIVVDEEHKVVTTPAYMLATRISEAAAGISRLVDKIVELANA